MPARELHSELLQLMLPAESPVGWVSRFCSCCPSAAVGCTAVWLHSCTAVWCDTAGWSPQRDVCPEHALLQAPPADMYAGAPCPIVRMFMTTHSCATHPPTCPPLTHTRHVCALASCAALLQGCSFFAVPHVHAVDCWAALLRVDSRS